MRRLNAGPYCFRHPFSQSGKSYTLWLPKTWRLVAFLGGLLCKAATTRMTCYENSSIKRISGGHCSA